MMAKKAQTKKRTPSKSLSMPMISFLACLTLGLTAFGCLFAVQQFCISPIKKQQANISFNTTGKLIALNTKKGIENKSQQLMQLTNNNPQFYSQLDSYSEEPDPKNQQAILAQNHRLASTIISQIFPDAKDIRVLPYSDSGTAGLKRANITLHNNIELSLFSKTTANKPTYPELYKVNDQWRITFSTPITKNEKILGVALVSFDASLFHSLFEPLKTTVKNIQLVTKKHQVIYQASSLPITNKLTFEGPTPQTVLKIGFIPHSINSSALIPLYASFFFLALLGAILCLMITLLVNNKLKKDTNALTQFIGALTGLHDPHKPHLALSRLNPILDALTKLNGHIIKNAVNTDSDSSHNDVSALGNTDTKAQTTKLSTSVHLDPVVNKPFPDAIFRDYDIRGHATEQLSPELAYQIGRSIASEALEFGQTSLTVGADCRLSSPELKQHLIQGLLESGCDVIDIGTVPSPLLYFSTQHLNTNAGVMVTASHNPGHDNGFKIILDGKSLQGSLIQKLKTRIKNQQFAEGKGVLRSSDAIEPAYSSAFNDDIIIAKPLKVVLDGSHGAGGSLAQTLLESLDCEVIPLNCTMDGNFPHHAPDPCNPDNLKTLIQTVSDQQADLGIALDGDADRMVAITNEGAILHGDQLLMLFASDIVATHPGCHVVFDIKCSKFLTQTISDLGGRPIIWKTGHSHIKQKMLETQALLGGEYTGHFCFKDRWFGFDDGIYAAARLIEILAMNQIRFHEKYLALPHGFSTDEIHIDLNSDQEKFALIDRLQAKLQVSDATIIDIDGIRIEYTDGWGLIRASNTRPSLTARFEADSKDALSRIYEQFQSALTGINPNLTLSVKD